MLYRRVATSLALSLPVVGFSLALGATGLMRLGELWVSRGRIAERPADALVGEPALFPAMAGLHTALVVLPLAEVWFLERAFQSLVAGLAFAVLLVATGLRVWTLRTIGIAWNVRVVRPESETVVTRGPYRFIRHPNYLCVILELAALPLLHSAWISAVVLTLWNAAVLSVRIRTEEAMLMEIPQWRDAFADRARLIPGVF